MVVGISVSGCTDSRGDMNNRRTRLESCTWYVPVTGQDLTQIERVCNNKELVNFISIVQEMKFKK